MRVDGQPSVYLPVLKQGGDANTIAVVDGIKHGVSQPARRAEAAGRRRSCSTSRVFVRNAIENLIHEGVIGLVLTGVMILVFLGSLRGDGRGVSVHSALGAGGLHRAVDGRTAPSTP